MSIIDVSDTYQPRRLTRQLDASSSDAELAMALISRNPRASQLAWQRFMPLVRRMLRNRIGSSPELEDIVQDVFLGLFGSIHKLRRPDALRAFVITVTKRTLGHEVERRRLRYQITLQLEPEHLNAVGDTADAAARHALAHFRKLLARLKERERRAFLLRFVENLAAEEVAAALGTSVPTARRAFDRAWQRIMVWAQRSPFLSDYVVAPADQKSRLRE